jgi:hypothetical protein
MGLLLADGGVGYVGPFTDVDVETTDLVRPRYGQQLVPSGYAAVLVHRKGIKPGQASIEVGGIVAVGNTEACGLCWYGYEPHALRAAEPVPKRIVQWSCTRYVQCICFTMCMILWLLK